MKPFIKPAIAFFSTITALGLAAPVCAEPLFYGAPTNENITIFDNERSTQGTAPIYEDNEAEPGMEQKQRWDLEGFFFDKTTHVLTMIGGFNFLTGVQAYPSYTSGDIFISTDATYGRPLSGTMYKVNTNGDPTTTIYDPLDGNNGNVAVSSPFGYEYALDVNWTSSQKTYNTIKLDANSDTKTVWFHQNEDGTPSSNPWLYYSDGTDLVSTTEHFTGGDPVTDSGFSGWDQTTNTSNGNHYAVSFDLTNLLSIEDLWGEELYFHFTMGCGNDNLMGHTTAPVPEPQTMLLFGSGLAGLGSLIRRKRA